VENAGNALPEFGDDGGEFVSGGSVGTPRIYAFDAVPGMALTFFAPELLQPFASEGNGGMVLDDRISNARGKPGLTEVFDAIGEEGIFLADAIEIAIVQRTHDLSAFGSFALARWLFC
jgi:hypothetical protein